MMKKLFFITLVVSLLFACEKEHCDNVENQFNSYYSNNNCVYTKSYLPFADFDYYFDNYFNNGLSYIRIITKNNSEHAYKYQWALRSDYKDPRYSNNRNPDFVVLNGIYKLSLIASNHDNSEGSFVEKEIMITTSAPAESSGMLMFWTDNPSYGDIAVNVNGDYVGTITTAFADGDVPICGTLGCVTIERWFATYTINAVSESGHTWTFYVSIQNGSCANRKF